MLLRLHLLNEARHLQRILREAAALPTQRNLPATTGGNFILKRMNLVKHERDFLVANQHTASSTAAKYRHVVIRCSLTVRRHVEPLNVGG